MLMEINFLENNKLVIKVLKIIGIFLIPIIFYSIPLQWLENSDSIFIFKNFVGKECYGCGITRACLEIMHLNFTKAWYYNKLVVIVFPLLVLLWFKILNKAFKSNEKNR